MNKMMKNTTLLKGWAIDEDPQNDPTYPMRKRTATEIRVRPEQQIAHMEVLHSNERPHYTAVFGETIPPKGLSGHLRRYAFRYSESRYRHWLPLLLADRIHEVEGVIDDLSKGTIPNLFAETGVRALWKYNKKKFIKGCILYGIGTAALVCTVVQLLRKK